MLECEEISASSLIYTLFLIQEDAVAVPQNHKKKLYLW